MIKVNTTKVKDAGKFLMVLGGSIFSLGGGLFFVGNHIEKKEEKLRHQQKLNFLDEQAKIENQQEVSELNKAKIDREISYKAQLDAMDKSEFAEFHAEKVAKANEDVLKKAEDIRKKSEAEIIQTKLDCTEEVEKLRKECLEKIQKANTERDEAQRKYEAIDSLFTNKKDILKAKEELKELVDKTKRTEESKKELINDLKDLLE